MVKLGRFFADRIDGFRSRPPRAGFLRQRTLDRSRHQRRNRLDTDPFRANRGLRFAESEAVLGKSPNDREPVCFGFQGCRDTKHGRYLSCFVVGVCPRVNTPPISRSPNVFSGGKISIQCVSRFVSPLGAANRSTSPDSG